MCPSPSSRCLRSHLIELALRFHSNSDVEFYQLKATQKHADAGTIRSRQTQTLDHFGFKKSASKRESPYTFRSSTAR